MLSADQLADYVMKAGLGLLAWLGLRAVKGLDGSISSLGQKIDRLEVKQDATSANISDLRESNVEIKVRMGLLETEQAAQKSLLQDFGGFLSSIGFKKRDG